MLAESVQFGDDLLAEREAVTKQYNRVLEKTSAKLQSLAQSDDFELIQQTLAAAENQTTDVRPDWEALERHRDHLLEKARQHLKQVAAPHGLQLHSLYGQSLLQLHSLWVVPTAAALPVWVVPAAAVGLTRVRGTAPGD